MRSVSVKNAKASFSRLVDEAIKGESVTITRHGKPVAVMMSVEAARKASQERRPGLVAYPRTFPGGDFERNRAPSLELER